MSPAVKKPKPSAKTGAERIKELRERRAAIMLAEVRGVFAHVADHPEIKSEAARIARRRERAAKKEHSHEN